MTHFALLSVTAGVCEEILYRAYLIWYVAQFTGAGLGGLALAVAVSALIFGIAHLYQGLTGATRVAGIALVFGGVYVLSEAVWLVILLHVYMDLAGGLLSLAVHRARGCEGAPDGQ
jgi:membrane protease YdiL (CAAX protease family)